MRATPRARGAIQALFPPIALGERDLLLSSLCVAHAWRRNGIGPALVRQVLNVDAAADVYLCIARLNDKHVDKLLKIYGDLVGAGAACPTTSSCATRRRRRRRDDAVDVLARARRAAVLEDDARGSGGDRLLDDRARRRGVVEAAAPEEGGLPPAHALRRDDVARAAARGDREEARGRRRAPSLRW